MLSTYGTCCPHPPLPRVDACRRTAATPLERRKAATRLAAGERASVAGDEQVLRWLHTACTAWLAFLPTTVQEDEQELAAPAVTASATGVQGGSATEVARGGADTAGDKGTGIPASGLRGAEAQAVPDEGPSCRQLAITWRLLHKRWVGTGLLFFCFRD